MNQVGKDRSNRDFNPVAVIARKRDGRELDDAEIARFVADFTSGRITDYQMAAWAMAVYLRGMSARETVALTDAMLSSGKTLSWPAHAPPIVDKHSTGGVGDKVSLLLAPLLACCGLWVPMISGRGLGTTGGTLDKLEAIPGFRTDLSLEELQQITAQVGCVITGATAEIAPADRKLYALRDVTATVASIPLITASIMSKKLAEGLNALVLDVKWGSGAFMKSLAQAQVLADALVATGERMGVRTMALLTDMNQPLGRTAGNAVEVNEVLDALSGQCPPDLLQVTLDLGAQLLAATGTAAEDQAQAVLQDHLDSGAAWEKFHEMVRAQGGRLDGHLPVAPAHEFLAAQAGILTAIDTEQLGWAVIELGGGRQSLADRIDPRVGLEMLVRVGDKIERGQPLIRILAKDSEAGRIHSRLHAALRIEMKV